MSAAEGSAPQVRFTGYAAWFDAVDRGGDAIRPGAFAASLAEGRAIPLLWQHDGRQAVGTVDHAEEDGRGLRIVGRAGGAAARALADGSVRALSFGYRARGATRDLRGVRTLTDIDLIEISLVARPMQPRARVTAVQRLDGEGVRA